MSSWRQTVIRRDRSGTVIADTGVTGAMVIRASKGLTEPTLITVGSESKIIDLFGYPSVNHPDVWEAIQYNNVGDVWISAPSPATDTMGGVAVLDSGVVPLGSGLTISDLDTYTFTSLDHVIEREIAQGDGVETTFTYTIPYSISAPATDLDIKVGGVSLASLDVGGTAPDYTITATDLASGSYNSTTGLLTLTFSSAVADGSIISIEYTHSAVPYFLLLSKSPMEDAIAVRANFDTVNSWWELDIFRKNIFNNSFEGVTSDSIIASNDPTKIDGFGASVFIGNKLENNDYIRVLLNTDVVTQPTVSGISEITPFKGGSRTTTTITELTLGWNEFKKADQYPAELFLDPTAIAGIASQIETIVTTFQKYSYGGIVALPLGLDSAGAISAKQALGLSSPDVAVYCNQGKVHDVYNNGYFWTTLVGRIGQRYALMSDIFFAGAPFQSNDGIHGGQLGGGIKKLENSYSESELKAMDEAGLNPLSFKPAFGVMIESQKTCQSTTTLSDYSFIAHRNLFNYLIRNISEQVLTPQIGKLNNQSNQLRAKTNAELIVNPVLDAGYLRDALVVCDASNNTDEVLARREFILDVVVQVTPYSERVVLRFTNIGQTVSVQEFV